jgi:hypothetical protein
VTDTRALVAKDSDKEKHRLSPRQVAHAITAQGTTEAPTTDITKLAVRPLQTTQDEKDHILSLRDAGHSIRAIAAIVDRDKNTVNRIIAEAEDEQAELARNLLKLKAKQFACDWSVASAEAAKKGDHRPAKDGLVAAGVIEDKAAAQAGAAVQIVIGMPGAPAGPDPFDVVDSKGPTAPTVLDA